MNMLNNVGERTPPSGTSILNLCCDVFFLNVVSFDVICYAFENCVWYFCLV